MMQVRRTVPLVFVLAAAVSGVALRAQAVKDISEFVDPFIFESLNPCNGEAVLVTGETRVSVRTTISNDGTTHIKYQLVPDQIRGVGESGARYRAVGGERDHTSFSGEGEAPLNETFTSAFNLVSSGQGQNFTTHFTGHITIDANGVTTSDVAFDHGDCRGK
jgi:hypothetical protein